MKVILPGISGLLARIVAKKLAARGHDVIGIDSRPWHDAPKGVVMHTFDIRKRAAEDVFRSAHADAVIHMATVTHLRQKSEDRYRINLGGTRAVWDHCHTYQVPQAIFVGRHTYYGAAPDSPLYHTEEEPPSGATTFPESSPIWSPPISTRAPRSGVIRRSRRRSFAFVTRSARRITERSRVS